MVGLAMEDGVRGGAGRVSPGTVDMAGQELQRKWRSGKWAVSTL